MSLGEQHGAGAGSGSYPSFDRIVHRLAPLGGTDDGDLWLLAKTPADHVVEKVALACVAAIVVVGYVVISAHPGEVPLRRATSVAVLAAMLGFMTPVWVNRAAAARLRRDLRAMLSTYLDILVIVMVGRPRDDRVFVEATRFVDGPGVPQLRAALTEADVRPVEALGDAAAAWGLHDIETVMTRLRIQQADEHEIQRTVEAKATALRHEVIAAHEVPSRRRLDGELLGLGMMLSALHLFLLFPFARTAGWI